MCKGTQLEKAISYCNSPMSHDTPCSVEFESIGMRSTSRHEVLPVSLAVEYRSPCNSCLCLHFSGTVQVQKQFSKPRTDHNSGYSVSVRCIAVMGRGHNAVMGRGLAPSHSTSVIPSVLYMFLILLVYGTSERS